MNKKAFTLTELLVVVVIIGTLAAVVLPKFAKVLETRKTTEAEQLMAAVRNEQEARCTLDMSYVQEAHKDRLASLPSNTGNNYTYTLTGSGMLAKSQDKNYQLRIKSYEDGRICCEAKEAGNSYCASLNKKYPSCDDLPADNSGCGVADVGPSPNPCAGGDCEPSCDENAPSTSQKCTPTGYSTECGEQTRSVKCDASTNYEWQQTDWGTCQATSECKNPSTCTDGETRKVTETAGGCADVIQRCKDGEWQPHESVLKEDTECTPGQKDGDLICNACRWSCPDGKKDMGDKKCCLPGQIVKNGQCLYKYRPNRFDVNILVVCHSSSYELTMPANAIISEEQFNEGYMGYNYQYSSYAEYKEAIIRQYSGTQGQYGGGGMMAKPAYCKAMGYAYYRGGNIPWVNEGDGCDSHYSYYNRGNWWVGGTRVQGNQVYGSDQDWCDKTCGQKTSCSDTGFVDKGNPPDRCDSYHCSNGWHCDNAPGGTGVALECIREY